MGAGPEGAPAGTAGAGWARRRAGRRSRGRTPPHRSRRPTWSRPRGAATPRARPPWSRSGAGRVRGARPRPGAAGRSSGRGRSRASGPFRPPSVRWLSNSWPADIRAGDRVRMGSGDEEASELGRGRLDAVLAKAVIDDGPGFDDGHEAGGPELGQVVLDGRL